METQPYTSRRAKKPLSASCSPPPELEINDPQIPPPQIPNPQIPPKRCSEPKQLLSLYDFVQYQSSSDILFNKILKDIIRKMKNMAFHGTTDVFETVDKIPPLHCYTLFHQLIEEKSIIHKQKPIPWCTNCKVSLLPPVAVFLKTVTQACYVTFPFDITSVRNIFGIPEFTPSSPSQTVSFLVWTTSPWSLPLNQALALHPGVKYSLLQFPYGIFVVASSRISHVDLDINGKTGISPHVLGEATGKEICCSVTHASHVFQEKGNVPVVLSDGVSENMGTGVVHIVPGCSETDYCVGLKYCLPVECPIDEEGRFTSNIFPTNLAGLSLPLASTSVLKALKTMGRLITTTEVEHPHPHCPTCQLPLIYLTKSHWFWIMGGVGVREATTTAATVTAINTASTATFIPKRYQKWFLATLTANTQEYICGEVGGRGHFIPALVCKRCSYSFTDQSIVNEVTSGMDEVTSGMDGVATFISRLIRNSQCPCCGTCDSLVWDSSVFSPYFEQLAMASASSVLSIPHQRLYVENQLGHAMGTFALLLGNAFRDSVVQRKDLATVKDAVTVRKDVVRVRKDAVMVRKDAVTAQKDWVTGETSIIFVHAYCRLAPDVSPEELSSLPGDVFRIWVVCSKYAAEELLVTKESLKEALGDYALFGHFFRELMKFTNPHICQKPQSLSQSLSGGIESYLLTNLHKTNTKIQKAYSLLDLSGAYMLARSFVDDFNTVYWPMILCGETSTGYVSRKGVLTILEVFAKLLAPFLPDLAEEAYHWVIFPRCDQSTDPYSLNQSTHNFSSVHQQSFMETEDKMNKEIKQRWEALERLRELVEKEKNRFMKEKGCVKGKVVVSLVVNITSCRDGNAVYLLLEGEGLMSLLDKFFGVDVCYVKFVQDTDKKFSKNLKQACMVDMTLEEP